MQACAQCAAPVRPGARFCTRCGAPIGGEPTPTTGAVPVSPSPISTPGPVTALAAAPDLAAPDRAASDPAPTDPAAADLAAPVRTAPNLVAPDAELEPVEVVPSRIPSRGRVTAPPARSDSATWAFVAGIAPLFVSVAGNLIAAHLGSIALERVAAGEPQGAWGGVLVTLALVFVLNAGLLTVCAISGVRGIRETANGITRGRGLAVAGLAVGALNLILWVTGLVLSVTGLEAALA
jgi:hypothetical protein